MPLTGINLLTEQTSSVNVLPEEAAALMGAGAATGLSGGAGVVWTGACVACGDGPRDGFGAGFVAFAS
jgi:hypothetical protein